MVRLYRNVFVLWIIWWRSTAISVGISDRCSTSSPCQCWLFQKKLIPLHKFGVYSRSSGTLLIRLAVYRERKALHSFTDPEMQKLMDGGVLFTQRNATTKLLLLLEVSIKCVVHQSCWSIFDYLYTDGCALLTACLDQAIYCSWWLSDTRDNMYFSSGRAHITYLQGRC